MKRINKSEPSFFTVFVRRNKPVNWEGISEIRPRLRDHILETEQSFQCAYCESEITSDKEKSNIDHFKRKSIFPELTFDYNNLLVSCKNEFHCSTRKDRIKASTLDYNNIVDPVHENPEDYFDFYSSGKLISKNEKADYTKEVFNLNHPGLKQQRNDVAWAVNGFRDSMELDEVIAEIGAFESFIRAIW